MTTGNDTDRSPSSIGCGGGGGTRYHHYRHSTPLPAAADAGGAGVGLAYVFSRLCYRAIAADDPALLRPFVVNGLALRRSDIMPSAIDFHCSKVLESLLSPPTPPTLPAAAGHGGSSSSSSNTNETKNGVGHHGRACGGDDGDDGGGHSDLVHRKLREIVPGGDQDELEAVVKGAMWACSSATNVKRCVRQVATLLCCGGSSRRRRVA